MFALHCYAVMAYYTLPNGAGVFDKETILEGIEQFLE